MQRFKNILVGVDLTAGDRLATSEMIPTVRAAIDHAMLIAEKTKARITFFAAIELSAHARELMEHNTSHSVATVEEAALTVLKQLCDEAHERGIEAGCELVWGRDWEEIVKYAIRNESDLLLIGVARYSKAGRILFGSAGMKLLRYCPIPVWVTKPGPHPEIAQILVASDLTEVGREALELTVSGGQMLGAQVYLIHAVEPERHLLHWGVSEEKLKAQHDQAVAGAKQLLQEQLDQTDHHTLEHEVTIEVVDGTPEDAVMGAIDRHGIDLLVMGTTGTTGIAGFLVGSTAERLLPRVPCSVLAIKPHDFVSPVKVED